MGRANSLCRLCGGPKRGRSARGSFASITCGTCHRGVCTDHAFWHNNEWICNKCARAAGIKAPPP